MARYRRYKRRYRRPQKMSKEEEFQWIVATVVFVVAFVVYFTFGFISNCIWEWPPRWDVGTCWNEQIDPAKDKASEKATPFVP